MIAVTGASGHLGSVITSMLPECEPIGRSIPRRQYEAIIHTAAPNYRNDDDVHAFRAFNQDLAEHITEHPPDVLIITGSWWQHAIGTCTDLAYTHLKTEQRNMFPNAIHLIPFSIYGNEARPGRGFIPQLINTINTSQALQGLSRELRDFIHVTDVALAHIQALNARPGIYELATGRTITPADLAHLFDVTAPPYDEHPTAHPQYLHERLPNWEPTINVINHIKSRI